MSTREPLSAHGRLVVGMLFVALGLLPILAAFDLGPLYRRDINGPPWLGAVAGGIFVLGGVFVFAGERARNHPLSYVLALAVIAGFAAIADWIAFGAGPRQCSAGFSGFVFTSTRAAAEIECRIAFGIGAGIMNGILVWMLADILRKAMGPSPWLDRLERIGQGVLLVSLAPILIPIFVFLISKALFEGSREYFRTGKWPRNEAFIARMKQRRKSG